MRKLGLGVERALQAEGTFHTKALNGNKFSKLKEKNDEAGLILFVKNIWGSRKESQLT